jgi:hypothetical protein
MRKAAALITIAALAATACVSERPDPTAIDDIVATGQASQGGAGAVAMNIVDLANSMLETQGAEYRVAYAEYLTTTGMPASQNIILARDVGLQRLPHDFIPGDPRRATFDLDGDPNTIDVIIDQIDGATTNGLTVPVTTTAIARAMGTWDAQTCSSLGMNLAAAPFDLGLVQAILGFGGGVILADIMHAGWMPGAFFDLVLPGGSGFILGVTFTLTFTTGDLDGNGLADVAAREIYYNDAFPWADNGINMVDVETVALHEAGHGLSQNHFGKIFFNPNSGKLVFSPLAVMNAGIAFPNRDLDGTDVGGHCGTWGNWPNN